VRVRVTNQSFKTSPVDIHIAIDEKELVAKDFAVGTQHTYESFFTKLSDGEHQIVIESKKAKARHEGKFSITQKNRWVEIGFVTDPDAKFYCFVADENRKTE
jgi:hypothetical protein